MTKYEVVARRRKGWWELRVVSGLPEGFLGVSQTRRLNQVETVSRELIVDLLDLDSDAHLDVEVHVELDDELANLQDLFVEANEVEANARKEAVQMRSVAAQGLIDSGMTMREAAILLGVSHQRIKQLADRAVQPN